MPDAGLRLHERGVDRSRRALVLDRSDVRRDAETSRDEILAKARAMLDRGRTPQEALDYLAHTLTNKLLHAPSARLRDAAMSGDLDLLHAAGRLYGLDPDDDVSA